LCLRSDGIGDRGRERCNVISCCMDAFAIIASLFIHSASFRSISYLFLPFVSNILYHLPCPQLGGHPVQLLITCPILSVHSTHLYAFAPVSFGQKLSIWARAFPLFSFLFAFLRIYSRPCLGGSFLLKGASLWFRRGARFLGSFCFEYS